MHANEQTLRRFYGFYDAFARLEADTIVDNAIDARFTFTPDGLIATHRDRFSFRAWARQALGLPGLLLGWSPSPRRKVRGTAASNLKAFLARNP
jgi:hypothetical protein